jgi:glycosyltransferase involved in cell wall biosynthesis
MKFSVIIPAFNAHKTLDKMLKSVLTQTYKNIEVIIVNDASTDNTLDICEQWAQKDQRIKVINLSSNGGVSNARNAGLRIASGDYVMFLDSDDSLDESIAIFNQSLEISSADILIYGIKENYYDEENQYINSKIISLDNVVAKDKQAIGKVVLKLLQNTAFRYACNKVHRRQLLVDNALVFDEISYGEDIRFNFKVVSGACVLETLNIAPYQYNRFAKGSLMNKFDISYLKNHFALIDQECEYFKQIHLFNLARNTVAEELLKFIFVAFQMKYYVGAINNLYTYIWDEIYAYKNKGSNFDMLLKGTNGLTWKYMFLTKLLYSENETLIMSFSYIIYLLKHKYIKAWQKVVG